MLILLTNNRNMLTILPKNPQVFQEEKYQNF
jgi:hypothetical protein